MSASWDNTLKVWDLASGVLLASFHYDEGMLCCAWESEERVLAACAEWNPELLALELQELERAKYDLSLTGFDAAELDELLISGPTIVDTAEAAPPAPEAPVSRAGDLWRLGPHRLLCGDATDTQAVARLLG